MEGNFVTELVPAGGRWLAVKGLFDTAGIRTTYERLALEALEGADLLLTPTRMFAAPPADVDELACALPAAARA